MNNLDPESRPKGWNEQDSQIFIDLGRYFVPDRERQLATICQLIPPQAMPFVVVELCCGEGLLAGEILAAHPTSTLIVYDGAAEMLAATRQRLAAYSERLQTRQFDLAATDWRTALHNVHAVVSSLAIHHLDGAQKARLFRDVYAMLVPGGVFVIADVILPAHPLGFAVAAAAWDEAVQERALALDGTLDAFTAFQRERWNMYRDQTVPDDVDKPSTVAEQLQWLRQAGFVGVDLYWMRAGHAIFAGYK